MIASKSAYNCRPPENRAAAGSGAATRRARFCALTLCLILPALFSLVAGPAADFHFRNYLDLRSGERFHIFAVSGSAAGSQIGAGTVVELSARSLHMRFALNSLLHGEAAGTVRLRYLGRRGSQERFRLQYSGRGPDGPIETDEEVAAASFLVDAGILAFRFLNERYFLQISRDSRGQNKFITTWGSSRLSRVQEN